MPNRPPPRCRRRGRTTTALPVALVLVSVPLVWAAARAVPDLTALPGHAADSLARGADRVGEAVVHTLDALLEPARLADAVTSCGDAAAQGGRRQ